MDWNASRAVFNFCLVWSSRKFSFLLNERRSAAAAAVVTETRLYSTLTATLWLQTYTRHQRGSCSTAQWPNISLQQYVFSNIVAHNSVKALWKHSYIFPPSICRASAMSQPLHISFSESWILMGESHSVSQEKNSWNVVCVSTIHNSWKRQWN